MDEWEERILLSLIFKLVKLFFDKFEIGWLTVNFKRKKK